MLKKCKLLPALIILMIAVTSTPAGATHAWRDAQGRIYHRPDTGGVTDFTWGDWLGNETFRSAFRARLTDLAPTSWEWAASLHNLTASGSSSYCTVPNPSASLRKGVYDACVGDYVSYFNQIGYPNAFGLAIMHSLDYRDGTAHIKTARFLIDSGRNNTTFLRQGVICQEAGHLMGLDHNSDPTSCMYSDSSSDAPNNHDHAQADDIYAHNDSFQF